MLCSAERKYDRIRPVLEAHLSLYCCCAIWPVNLPTGYGKSSLIGYSYIEASDKETYSNILVSNDGISGSNLDLGILVLLISTIPKISDVSVFISDGRVGVCHNWTNGRVSLIFQRIQTRSWSIHTLCCDRLVLHRDFQCHTGELTNIIVDCCCFIDSELWFIAVKLSSEIL